MGWTTRAALGAAAAMTAGASLACGIAPCPNPDAGWAAERYEAYRSFEARSAPRPGHWRRDVRPRADGELTLPSSFFAGGGGVGPIPYDPIWTGTYVHVRRGGFAGAHAFSAASASANASARVRVGR